MLYTIPWIAFIAPAINGMAIVASGTHHGPDFSAASSAAPPLSPRT